MRKFVILRQDCFGSDSRLMELQNFSQLIVDSNFFCSNFFLQLVYDGFVLRILGVIVQPPKPLFFFNEIWGGLTNR